jgi:hypothetical protein
MMNTEMPADINALTDDDIAALEADLVAEFDALHDAGSADVATLTEIAEAVEQVRNVQAERVEAAVAAAEAVAALADRVRPAAEADPEDDAEEEIVEAVVEDTPELVTAAAPAPKKPSARSVRRYAPAPVVDTTPTNPVTITAAADIPGFVSGSDMDTLALARALHAKARTLSNHSGYIPVASIDLGIEHKMSGDVSSNIETLERVTKVPENLVASGWCAPSQNLYDLFSIDAGDGLVDLPTVQVTRGGLNVPGFLGIDDAEGALWTWTEDSADDEETKQCLYIPCPEFTDYRLVAEGLCITAGNLTDRAFPELTRRFVSLAINAHLHRLSAAIINQISGSATGVTVGAVNATGAGELLNAIDLQVADYRSQYRMSLSAVLEAIFPAWVLGMVRADLALRHGAELTNVTDDVVRAHFAARGVRAQFVHDYQPLYSGNEATAWPSSLEFLLFPAGGYVKGTGGTIDLGVVRDSVLNATNDYTAAWTEELYLVAQVGPDAREVEVAITVDGCQPINFCSSPS